LYSTKQSCFRDVGDKNISANVNAKHSFCKIAFVCAQYIYIYIETFQANTKLTTLHHFWSALHGISGCEKIDRRRIYRRGLRESCYGRKTVSKSANRPPQQTSSLWFAQRTEQYVTSIADRLRCFECS
jgi:hypothetical protein